MSPFAGSTATPEGLKKPVWLEFKALPSAVPSELSITPFGADLHQELASVVRVFLDDSVAAAC